MERIDGELFAHRDSPRANSHRRSTREPKTAAGGRQVHRRSMLKSARQVHQSGRASGAPGSNHYRSHEPPSHRVEKDNFKSLRARSNKISVTSQARMCRWSAQPKSMTGHLLGAAGSLEPGLTVLALRDQVAPPTTNVLSVDDACRFKLIRNEALQPLSNSRRPSHSGSAELMHASFSATSNGMIRYQRSLENREPIRHCCTHNFCLPVATDRSLLSSSPGHPILVLYLYAKDLGRALVKRKNVSS